MKEQTKIKEKAYYIILPQVLENRMRSNDLIDDFIQNNEYCGLEIFIENNQLEKDNLLKVSYIDKMEDKERKLDVFKYVAIVKDTECFKIDKLSNVINVNKYLNKIKMFSLNNENLIDSCLNKCF